MPEFPLSKGDGTEPSVKIVRWKKVKVEKIWTVARKSTVTAEARELHTEERRILRRVGRTIKHSLSGSSPLVLQTPINLPLFFLCFLSSETLATLSSIFFSFSLSQIHLGGTILFFFHFSIRLQWVPDHSFLSNNSKANELAKGGALLLPFTVPCSLSPLMSPIDLLTFSCCRRTVSSKLFATQTPQYSLKHFCFLVKLAVSSFVFAAKDIVFC